MGSNCTFLGINPCPNIISFLLAAHSRLGAETSEYERPLLCAVWSAKHLMTKIQVNKHSEPKRRAHDSKLFSLEIKFGRGRLIPEYSPRQ